MRILIWCLIKACLLQSQRILASWPYECVRFYVSLCACIISASEVPDHIITQSLVQTSVRDLSFIQGDSKRFSTLGTSFRPHVWAWCVPWCMYSVQCSRWQYVLGLQTSINKHQKSQWHRQLYNICCCSTLDVALLFSLKIPTTSIASARLHHSQHVVQRI